MFGDLNRESILEDIEKLAIGISKSSSIPLPKAWETAKKITYKRVSSHGTYAEFLSWVSQSDEDDKVAIEATGILQDLKSFRESRPYKDDAIPKKYYNWCVAKNRVPHDLTLSYFMGVSALSLAVSRRRLEKHGFVFKKTSTGFSIVERPPLEKALHAAINNMDTKVLDKAAKLDVLSGAREFNRSIDTALNQTFEHFRLDWLQSNRKGNQK
jgi:hypothetical protein